MLEMRCKDSGRKGVGAEATGRPGRVEQMTMVARSTDSPVVRHSRNVSEREIAITLVLELAESGLHHFALFGFYDDDAEFLGGLAARLGVADDPVHRVKAMFDLAMALFNPALSLPLEGLRNRHPLAAK